MRRPTLKDWMEQIGLLLLVGIVRSLPVGAALEAGAQLGRFAFDVAGFRKRVTLANLEHHLGDRSAEKRTRIGRTCYENFGRSAAEFARLPGVDDDYISKHIETEGLEHLDRALGAGRGAVLVTGHFGSWELMGCVLVKLGYPVKFVIGVQRNPLTQHLMNDLRLRSGIEIVEGNSTVEIVRSLRANRFLAMLSDQDAGGRGAFVEFMGEPASTPQGAARLALASGAPLIPGFIIRTGGSGHRIVIEQPVAVSRQLDRAEAVQALTQAYTSVIETYVKRYPDHWLWAHRRWKTRPR